MDCSGRFVVAVQKMLKILTETRAINLSSVAADQDVAVVVLVALVLCGLSGPKGGRNEQQKGASTELQDETRCRSDAERVKRMKRMQLGQGPRLADSGRCA